MQLSFNNNYSDKFNKYKYLLERLTKKAFRILKCKENFVIELNFVDNKTIKKINREFRKKDKVTDVLSFAFLELKENEIKIKSKDPQFLGEIDISIERTILQAKELNHTFIYELAYLYLHGLLHLFGYDHVTNKKDEKIMFAKEEEILKGEDFLKSELADAVFDVIDNSYSPYSHCRIAASLKCKNNKIYKGVNVENCAYPSGLCAERNALFASYTAGENINTILELAIFTDGDEIPYPCGACRQVMAELMNMNCPVYIVDKYVNVKKYSVKDFIPHSFKLL